MGSNLIFMYVYTYQTVLDIFAHAGESVVSESTLRGGADGQDTSVDKEEEGASTIASTEQSEAVTQETR